MTQMLNDASPAQWWINSVHAQVNRESRLTADAAVSARALRILDVIGALAIILLLLPFLAIISLAVFVSGRGPIVFKQRRIGRDGVVFFCWKFRTMVVDAEERLAELLSRDPHARAEWQRDHKLRRDPRITYVGRLLRKSSLDELPQLFNVLAGTMSLVGPRPIVLAECSRYGRHFAYYCAVRPGITGLWQISGRNNVSYRRRVACDVLYSRKHSLIFNCSILLVTIPRVLLRTGAY